MWPKRFSTILLFCLLLIVSGVGANPLAGEIDVSFSGDGKLIAEIENSIFVAPTDLGVYPDGKIVVSALLYINQGLINAQQVALLRYQPNGTLDDTFGVGGIVTHSIDIADEAYSLLIQPDNKILVAGASSAFEQYDQIGPALLIRFTETGQLDTTFNLAGVVTTSIGSYTRINDIVLQDDGKILVGGYAKGISNTVATAFLARYTTVGELDNTFGINGVVVFDHGLSDGYGISFLAVQLDGKIIAIGPTRLNENILIFRYLVNGQPDMSFGANGVARIQYPGYEISPLGFTQRSDGKYVVVGSASATDYFGFVFAQFENNGDLAPTFDFDGVLLTADFSADMTTHLLAKASFLVDNQVVVCGSTTGEIASRFVLARFSLDGVHDISFGEGGFAKTSFDETAICSLLLLQSDGKIVAAGVVSGSNIAIALARYHNAPLINEFRLHLPLVQR